MKPDPLRGPFLSSSKSPLVSIMSSDEFQICNFLFTHFISADQISTAVLSPKGIISGICVRTSDSIGTLKQKIPRGADLLPVLTSIQRRATSRYASSRGMQYCARHMLTSCEIKAKPQEAKSNPRSNQRQQSKAQQAQQRLKWVLTTLSKEEKEALQKLLKDNEKIEEEGDKEANATKAQPLREVRSTYSC